MNISILRQLIESIEYPITKTQLMLRARQTNSDEDVLYAISQLPDVEYEMDTDVRKAIVEFV